MGSSKYANSSQQLQMAEDKKTIKNIIMKPFQALFQNKKKEKAKHEKDYKITETQILPPAEVTSVQTLLDNFQRLEIQKAEEEEDDEFNHFTFKAVEEGRAERIDSHSSQDSGFSEKDVDPESSICLDDSVIEPAVSKNIEHNETSTKNTVNETKHIEEEPKHTSVDPAESKETDVITSLKNLRLENGAEKPKKLQDIKLSRAPIRNKTGDYCAAVHPYGHEDDINYRQINQINKQTLSGGKVTLNANRPAESLTEVDIALKRVEQSIPHTTENQEELWDHIQELIDEEASPQIMESPENILADFIQHNFLEENVESIQNFVQNEICQIEPNAIDEFSNTNHFNYEKLEFLDTLSGLEEEFSKEKVYNNIFPTPPRSENIPSPMSDSQTSSFYPCNSEFSPKLSPDSDYEKYQEIGQFDEYPCSVTDYFEKDEVAEKKPRERNSSTSSMTMKQYKDLQKEISSSFSNKECCQVKRKACKQILQEHIQKLSLEERKDLCLKVANMDLKSAYGVLHHVLLSLSQDSELEDLNMALFGLVCERILQHQPALFANHFGLSVLKAAALRCPKRPFLTRYVVQCVRTALRLDPALAPAKDFVFREIDAQGDNLLMACARAGDPCADVLAELVRREPDDKPLFGVHHGNTEGYSALHVACRQHSASAPSLHVVHVLLEHAGADLWKGDVKGGDTALHLAVNSPTCELRLVMLVFRHVDRKLWKKLAHVHNRSSVTPLEYARCATKSTTRQNYPPEVLEFLKKCR